MLPGGRLRKDGPSRLAWCWFLIALVASLGANVATAGFRYAGHGHSPGESVLAATIARGLQLNRETAREAMAELIDKGEW